MKNKKFYLTFATKPEVSILLSKIAKSAGMTQPELINTICIDFIKNTLSLFEEQGLMTKTEVEGIIEVLESEEEIAQEATSNHIEETPNP